MSIADKTPSENPSSTTDSALPDSTGDLRGRLGTASLVLTVIAYNGPIIGLAGLVPLIISVGSGLAAPATFTTLGILIAIFAVGINAMATRMTHAGAFYTYVTAGMGRPPGLAAGMVAVLAYLAIGAGTTVMFGISFSGLLNSVFGVANPLPWQFWTVAAWIAIAVLSVFNIEVSAKVLGLMSCAEIVVALLWNARVYANGGPEGRAVDVVSSYFSGSLAFALVLGITCLTGFESLQVFRAETKDPRRTVPRATYISIAIMAGLYTVSTYAFIVAYGPSNALTAGAQDPTGSFLGSVASYVAKPVADIANVLLTTSSFAASLAIQTIVSRYLYSLGRDRVLPGFLGKPNAKHGSPMAASAIASGAFMVLLAVPLLSTIDPTAVFVTLIGGGTFCLILLYFMTSIAIVCFFVRRRERANRWETFVAPAISTVGLGAVVYVSIVHLTEVLGSSQFVANTFLMLIVVVAAAGVLAALWFRKSRPETYAKIGRQSEVVEV
jgi:amino acid transporter